MPPRGADNRIPPHDLDAEASLLGACMLERRAVIAALDAHVAPDDFYKPAHVHIYRAVLELYADDQPIDTTTVAVQLRRVEQLDAIGGRRELLRLMADTPASSNVGFYARVVRDAAQGRKMLRLAGELADAVYNRGATLPIIEALAHPATTETHGWGAVELGPVLAHDLAPPEPTMLCRDDGRHLCYPGRIHALNGESESLKSWLAVHGAAQEIRHGNDVLYLDFEDTPESICQRFLSLGVTADDILASLIYIRPDQPLDLAAGQHLERIVTTRQPTLAIIDGVTEAMTLEGLDLIDNADVAAWLARLPRRIKNLGPAVLLIDHITKNRENRGRGGIGGQHKLAGVDVAYLVEPILSLAHVAHGDLEPITGTSRITVEKDRPGGVRAFAANRKHVGELQLTAYPDGGVTAHIVPAVETRDGGFRPTVLMERVSKVLETAAAPLTKNAIRAAVKGKNDTKDLAIELLVADGFVVVETGARGAQLHRSERQYRTSLEDEDEDEPEEDDDNSPI